MIKTLYFRPKFDFEGTEMFSINLSKHINVILGPKGGGKSTLFDLLAGLKKGYLPATVRDALDSFGLVFVKAVTFSNEVINALQLTVKNDKEKKADYANRNDVIYQDDEIKKDINKAKDIDKMKFEYLTEIFSESIPSVEELIGKINKFYTKVKNIALQENKVNWTTTFEYKNTKKKLNLISSLNYNKSELNSLIIKQLENINKNIKNLKEGISNIQNIESIDFYNELFEDENFNNSLVTKQKEVVEKLVQLIQIFEARKQKVERIKKLMNAFEKVYLKKVDEFKAAYDKEELWKNYEKQALDHFKDTAKAILDLKKNSKEIINGSLELNIDAKEKEHNFLSFKLEPKILLNDEDIINLVKNVLHTPRTTNELSKWILENMKDKEFKAFDKQKIINCLSKNLKSKVMVLADGLNYANMSLGQRSIYGIKYKFKRSYDEDLFLDQPEDNLDNNTIATAILDLIKEKKNNQVFIVTHNANIGILSKPEKVIVADLNDKSKLYSEVVLVESNEKESQASLFLEGGLRFLEQRYKIVKGEDDGN